jgi:DNA-binding PadR family transcriptional regulator
MESLTAFQRDILFMVSDEEENPYGLAIKRKLEDYYNEEVNHGRLYPNLDDLVDEGYLEKGEVDKRTNWYGITDKGQEAANERIDWILEQTGRA